MTACSICLEPFEHSTNIVLVKHLSDQNLSESRRLGHMFHSDCIEQWKRSKQTASFGCPLDRVKVTQLYRVPTYEVLGFNMEAYNNNLRQFMHSVHITSKILGLINADDLDDTGRSLAFYACQEGNFPLVKKLHAVGANFNRPMSRDAVTPLMTAIQMHRISVVLFLLHKRRVRDSVVDTVDCGGNNAFLYACAGGDCEIIEAFVTLKLCTTPQINKALEYYKHSLSNTIQRLLIRSRGL